MGVTEAFIQFALSAVAIVVAGVFLVKSSDTIGELTGLGRLLAGSIFLAGATSLPEFLVDASAIRKGMPDLAVGDLMGSSLMNLLILAVADLLHHNPNKMFSRAGGPRALSAAISINMTVLACLAIFLGPQLAGYGLGEIGLGPVAIGVSYLLGIRLIYRNQPSVAVASKSKGDENRRPALAKAISIYTASAIVILIAAPFLAEAAGKIAEISGLGKTFVGTTLVAFCTSLPEIVSTAAAIRIGAFDLAVGNIFGSNSFNMILLIPLDLIHGGNLLGTISRVHVLTGLSVILATSVAVMGQLYQVEKRKKVIEPDAFAVIAIVIGSLLALFWVGAS